MNIFDTFKAAVETNPELPAIVKDSQSIKFIELSDEVGRYVSYLKKVGITKGDRVLVFVPISSDLYRIVLSLFKIGAVAVFLDEWSGLERLHKCCKIAECKAFIAPFKISVLALFSGELRKIPVWLKVDGYRSQSFIGFQENVSDDHPALMTFTTGSTGTPKAAVRSHGFLMRQFNAILKEIGHTQSMTCMTNLPIIVLINLATASTTILPKFNSKKPEKNNISKIEEQLQQWNVQRIIASPYFVKIISEYCLLKPRKQNHIQEIFTGGGPVFPDDATLFIKAFQGSKIQIIYGSTEAEPISSIDAEHLASSHKLIHNGLPVGNIHDDIKVKIIPYIDDEVGLPEIEVAPNFDVDQPGEIIVSGPHVLDKYFKDEQAIKRNKIMDPDGHIWHRTGDSGFLKDGQLFLTGRCNSLFEYKGHLYRTFIMEYELRKIEGVLLATVILWHDRPAFVFELDNAGNQSLVRQYCMDNYDTKAEIIFLDKIPKDPRHFSKIDYIKLKEVLETKV